MGTFGADEITFDDKGRLWAFMTAFTRTREHQWFQYRNGVLDHDTWASYLETIHIAFGSPRTRDWWNTMGRPQFPSAFVEMVDEMLVGQPPTTDIHDQVAAWN